MIALIRVGLVRTRRSLAAIGAAACLSLGLSPIALAAESAALRSDVTSSGATITLSDLFGIGGSVGEVMVGHGAPAGLDAVLDAGEVQRIAHMHGVEWDNPSGLRRIIVHSQGGHGPPTGAVTAASGRMIDALTYARNIGAGEIVQASDITYGQIPAFSAPQDMPSDAEAIIGKMAKRPLRAGSPAANRDVSAAQVIKRGDTLQVVYRDGGVSLTLQGEAESAAAVGEPVAVLNTASKKVIQAIAVGPDQAVVGPDADQFRQASLLGSNQFAALH